MGRSVLGWAFGICLSVLFIALWGRAVVVDTESLAGSIAPLAGTDRVVDFVAGWMGNEMIDSGVDPALVDPTVDYFLESSAVGDTVDEFVAEVVDAAASDNPNGSSIDMTALMGPAIPEVSTRLSGLGYPGAESEIREVVEGFDPLVIRAPGSPPLIGPGSPTATRLGTAAMLAFLGLLSFGAWYAALSNDRIAAVRSLLNRTAVGGLSFAVLLRLGSWIVDPGGGRAPVPQTLSNLAASQWFVPLQVAVGAATAAAVIYFGRRALRPAAGSPSPDVSAKPRSERQRSLTRRG